MKLRKVIISGGGTGGHIFPALSIADELRRRDPSIEILFVGAKGRMEMEKVPKAGYPIEGLHIAGIQRSLSLKNLFFPFILIKSLFQASRVISRFKPDVAVGVGGYASGPLLFVASLRGIPTMIQEQNSYPGITNKLLARSARKICVAYEKAKDFFPPGKVVVTGNPVRANLLSLEGKRGEAFAHFGLDPDRPVLLSIGGSLGARNINQAMMAGMRRFSEAGIQLLWQTGASFYEKYGKELKDLPEGVRVFPFVYEMDLAYSAADVVVSRAGALAITELAVTAKPCILVPSPYVSEDHQTKNAMALVEKNAAVLVREAETADLLVEKAIALVQDKSRQQSLSANISQLARPAATSEIVDVLTSVIQ